MMQNIYPSGLRPFSDVDVLIKRDALTRVKEILDGLGYRTSPKFYSRIEDFVCELNYVKADVLSVMIEPHWLLDPPYPYGKKICMKKLWRRSQPVDFLGLQNR
jgi:hypothetical protein